MRLLLTLLLLVGLLHAKDSRALLRRGNAAYSKGKLDEALKLYDEALVESPENPHLIFNRAFVFFKKGDFEKAKEAFQSSIDKLPNLKRYDNDLERRARIAIGNCCFMMAKQYADSEVDNALKLCIESIQAYENVLRINAKDKIARKNIAAARMLLKKILGIKYAQAQQQKQQQELARKLKELSERQKNAADNTAKADKSNGTEALQKEQERINSETEQLAKQLQPQQLQPQQQGQNAQQENPLSQARQSQDEALEKLKSKDLKEAEGKQREAAENLAKMLKQGEQQQQQQQQNGQENPEQKHDDGGKQDGADEKKQDDKKENSEEQQQESEQQQQANAAEEDKQESASEQEAQEIIDRERHDKRERDKNRRGSYRAVPMDW